MKNFLPFLTLIFLVSLIGLATYKLNEKQTESQDSQPSANTDESGIHFVKTKIALPEFSLPDLFDESQDFSLQDLKGKYTLVNFFASWCTTCRAEHGVLLRLRDAGIIDLYGVAWRDIDENTKEYLKNSGNPFKKIAKDSKGLFTKITGIEAVPESLIIDPEGNVVLRYRGNLQEFSIEEIRKFLPAN
jgi:DsbE subfamily thiol:disulfide oxidoreductase